MGRFYEQYKHILITKKFGKTFRGIGGLVGLFFLVFHQVGWINDVQVLILFIVLTIFAGFVFYYALKAHREDKKK